MNAAKAPLAAERIIRHHISTTVLIVGFICVTTFTAKAAMLPTAPVYDDLWDVSRGTVVTAHSPLDGSTGALAMLGGTYGQWEPDNVMFQDGHSPPYTHYIEWQTPVSVTIGAFNLAATADAPPNSDPSYSRRSFADFRLYAWDGAAFQKVFDSVPPMPYGGWWGSNNEGMPFSVVLEHSVTSYKWRAEFDQQVWTNAYLSPTGPCPAGYYGPRIVELDGFAPVPEPATLSLLALGGLALVRRRQGIAFLVCCPPAKEGVGSGITS